MIPKRQGFEYLPRNHSIGRRLPVEFLDYIWRPDVIFKNAKKVHLVKKRGLTNTEIYMGFV